MWTLFKKKEYIYPKLPQQASPEASPVQTLSDLVLYVVYRFIFMAIFQPWNVNLAPRRITESFHFKCIKYNNNNNNNNKNNSNNNKNNSNNNNKNR